MSYWKAPKMNLELLSHTMGVDTENCVYDAYTTYRSQVPALWLKAQNQCSLLCPLGLPINLWNLKHLEFLAKVLLHLLPM